MQEFGMTGGTRYDPSRYREKAVLVGLMAAVVLAATPGRASEPWVDQGFTEITDAADMDLTVVRERAFEKVDLTALGLGVQDYVQSIYFRLYGELEGANASSTGIVVFPEGVEILGFVTGWRLGGSEDDGAATETDALFGIDVDPDDYSAPLRGFESGGGPGASEFILSDSKRSFAFALNVGTGVDDFRVLIDYGSSFPADRSFDIQVYDLGEVGGAEPSSGIRVGDARGDVVGSGDFGEVDGLLRIPLTSNEEPEPIVAEEP